MRAWIVPVGGFLGAGKTTLILAAAKLLADQGKRCAAILNDQGDHLVDTGWLRASNVPAAEVAGACFCCRFSDLMEKLESLAEFQPEVIFIEPVGSCTDLSATVLQPLKRHFRGQFQLAPLTVLVDPQTQLNDPSISFLFNNQSAEADLVVFSKCDVAQQSPAVFVNDARSLSARSGQGVAAWLDEIFSGSITVGSKLLDIDYAAYARAEAALTWLNWTVSIELKHPLSPAELLGPFLDRLQSSLARSEYQLVHLKALDHTPTTYLKAAFVGDADEPQVEGDLMASPELSHRIRLNLRAVADPEGLRSLFESSLLGLPGARHAEMLQCFSPSAPEPEHRFREVVI